MKKTRRVRNDRDSVEEKVELYEKMSAEMATAHDLVRLSFLWGITSEEEYNDFLEIVDFESDS